MAPYTQLHWEHLVLLLGYGGLVFFGIVLALTGRRLAVGFHKWLHKGEEHYEEFPDGLREGHGPVPLFLICLYASLVVWALVYIFGHGLGWLEFGG